MSTIVESVTVLAVVDATVGSFEAVVCGAVVVTGTIGWLRVVCCGMCTGNPTFELIFVGVPKKHTSFADFQEFDFFA